MLELTISTGKRQRVFDPHFDSVPRARCFEGYRDRKLRRVDEISAQEACLKMASAREPNARSVIVH